MFGLGGPRGPRRRRGAQKARPQFEPEESSGGVLQTVINVMRPASRSSSAPGVRRSGRVRLVDLAVPTFAMVHVLRGSEVAPDPKRVRDQWQKDRERFVNAGKAAGHRDTDIEACVYAMCALIDETMLRFAEARDEWLETGALQQEFHGELLAGELVFTRLDELRQSRESAIEALEFYCTCISVGYRGRFMYLDDEEGVRNLLRDLLGDIRAVRGDSLGVMSPNGARSDEEAGEALRKMPVWIAPAALGAALLLSFATGWLWAFLHAGSVAHGITLGH
jgi:type VI secretion system protein ImpK